ncbi:MAG: sulfatase [Bacteroidota bacterium]
MVWKLIHRSFGFALEGSAQDDIRGGRQRFVGIRLLGLALVVAAIWATTAQAQDVQAQDAPPNLLVVIADDASVGDFGAYGHPTIQTPTLDALADSGWTAERAYLTSPQCSPSRASILSGQHPHEVDAEDLHMPVPEDVRLVPSYLADAGYATGVLQKVHLGPHGEAQFDFVGPTVADFNAFLDQSGGRPFFLWVGFTDPHRPYGDAPNVHAPEDVVLPPTVIDTPETRADYVQYYDEIARMDGVIGGYLDELEQRGLRDNTVVVFLSDNGAPMPRAKGTLYDAGIQTPLIIAGPGVPQGVGYDGLVSVIDLAPTLLDWAGVPVPGAFRGASIAGVIADLTQPGSERVFFQRDWHNADEHLRGLRTDRWKFIWNNYTEHPHGSPSDITASPTWQALRAARDAGTLTPAQARLFEVPRPRVELYNLAADPHELTNLAGDPALRDTVQALFAELQAWRTRTGDAPPHHRRRDDNIDRVTGQKYWGVRTPPFLSEESSTSND